MAGTLYVVSTPIGNLDDITIRAINTLKAVGLIAAEDTRRTANLLNHFGISTPTTSLHEHNEHQKIPSLLRKLSEGLDVALVSDAGTPLVADPGQRLVDSAIEHQVRVVPVPGASAVLSALVASGFPADQFLFAGFAPSKANDRKRWYQGLADETRTVVLFEAPHRLTQSLNDASATLGNRQIFVAREMTKRFEDTSRTTVNMLSDLNIAAKGEVTIVLAPIKASEKSVQIVDEKLVQDYFYQITKSSPSRRAAIADTARKFGLPTKTVYAIVERAKPSASS